MKHTRSIPLLLMSLLLLLMPLGACALSSCTQAQAPFSSADTDPPTSEPPVPNTDDLTPEPPVPNTDDLAPEPPATNAVSVKDGLRQNELVYLDDIYCADGKIYYTVVNRSNAQIGIGDKPIVQRKIDGEWQLVTLYNIHHDILYMLSPHTETPCSFTVDHPEALTPGEYRLLFGYAEYHQDENGNIFLVFSDQHVYRVGYLTVE